MDLYHSGATLTSEAPTGSKYLGCYKDLKSDRALTHKSTSSSDMDHDVRKVDVFTRAYRHETDCYGGILSGAIVITARSSAVKRGGLKAGVEGRHSGLLSPP